ncbi:MAG: polysaccharide biosynthesis tyrosine autokinase [Acidipropionibacterium jensenii]|nr:polysaccharide biosynthesis tyrosine autokinase [Acidipropionibacterium jensenii]
MQDYLKALRAHWWGVLSIFVLGILIAGAVTALQPKEYTASTTGIVSAVSDSSGTGASLAGDTLAQSKVKSYVDMGSWRTVAQYAITTLGLHDTPESLVNRVSVTNPLNTTIIQVTATAQTPKSAKDLAQAWLQGLVRQVNQVETAGGSKAMVTVIAGDSARLPSSPSSPNWKLNLLLGAVAGLALGAVYALIRDRNDQRIRSASDVLRVTGQAVVGALPMEPSIDKNPRLLPVNGSNDGDLSILAEAFRSLRTNLQYMSVDDPPRSNVVTSSAPGDGKSFTAANLAVALSATGQDVVLIDGDLRRPKAAHLFGIVGDVGLSDVLAGRAAFADVVQSIPGTETLRVLASGPVPPNPSEILGSARMRDLIKTLSRHSVVIIDAPPLLAVTDAAILSTRADGTFVVVKTGSTTHEMLSLAMDALNTVKGKVLGVILNRVPTKGSGKVYYGYRYTGEYYRDEKGSKHHKHHSGNSSRLKAGQAAETSPAPAGPARSIDAVSALKPSVSQAPVVTSPVSPQTPARSDSSGDLTGSARVPRRLTR